MASLYDTRLVAALIASSLPLAYLSAETGEGLVPHGTRVVPTIPTELPRGEARVTRALFVENKGQWSGETRFAGWFAGSALRATSNGFEFIPAPVGRASDKRAVLRFAFEGASQEVSVQGDGESGEAGCSLFLGNDPQRWRSDLATFTALRWHGLYEGVDLVVHFRNGRLEYDLELEPGADLAQVRLSIEGATSLVLEGDGSLSISTAAGEVVQRPPRSFVIDARGDRVGLESELVPIGDGFGFRVAAWSGKEHLVVDPELHWSTYLGGTTNFWGPGDAAATVAFGPDGDVYVAGRVGAHDFPITPSTWHAESGVGADGFVARFRGSDGELLYCSVFGGLADRGEWHTQGRNERVRDLAVDAEGQVTVVGQTDAGDFPTTEGAFQRRWKGPDDAYILRLSPMGETLVYSTLLGGSWFDDPSAVAIAFSGAAVVGGTTAGAPDFPTTDGAFKRDFDGNSQMGFLTRLAPDGGSLEWSTYLGGTGQEGGVKDLALDRFEQVTAVGTTSSDDFPVTPDAWNPLPEADHPIYVTRLNARGSDVVWSSTFGGIESHDGNTATCMALTPDGGVVVGGYSGASNFPTTEGAFQAEPNTEDRIGGVVIRLLPDGSDAVYSTWLQSPVWGSRVEDLAVDASGCVTAIGCVTPLFPLTPGAFDSSEDEENGFVSRLDPRGSKLLYSTLLGSSTNEVLEGVALTPMRRVVVAGSNNGGWPVTQGAYDTTFNGGQSDAVITVFDLLLEGVSDLGASTPACRGPLYASVTRAPVSGADDFALTCSGAPPDSMGFLLVGKPGYRLVGGMDLWVTKPWLRRPLFSDSDGWVEALMPLPPHSPGLTFAGQFLFETSNACPGPEPWSTSQAVVVSLR